MIALSVARSLRSARAYAIGVAYENPNPYYVIAIQNGLLATCREAGYGLHAPVGV